MPSKEFLLGLDTDPHGNLTKAIIDYSVANLGVQEKAQYFKKLSGGQVEASLRDSGGTPFSGVGTSKADAVAEAVSTKYPD